MVDRRTFSTMLIAGAASSFFGRSGEAQAQPAVGARNVVLVHGAYADGSCWSEVIGRLQLAGLTATAVQNPLTSLADDVAATRRILALQDGPTVLVGHSWAGTVISETGIDPKVSALVYIAARAPDADEDYAALAAKFPAPPANAGLVKSGGFAQLSEEAFLKDFAGGVDPDKARVLYAVQGRIADTLFASRTTAAAWKLKPSWYAVSRQDRTTSPELERFLAKRMQARTIRGGGQPPVPDHSSAGDYRPDLGRRRPSQLTGSNQIKLLHPTGQGPTRPSSGATSSSEFLQ